MNALGNTLESRSLAPFFDFFIIKLCYGSRYTFITIEDDDSFIRLSRIKKGNCSSVSEVGGVGGIEMLLINMLRFYFCLKLWNIKY